VGKNAQETLSNKTYFDQLVIIMKKILRTVLEGIGSGIALGTVMGLLILWIGISVFPDIEVIYLLIGVALLVGVIIWVTKKTLHSKG